MKASNFIEEWVQEGWGKRLAGRLERRLVKRMARGQDFIRLLKKILGRVSSELEKRISVLTDYEIEELNQDLLDMKVQSDLEQWFQIQEKNNKKK